jgi:hypothetical protein
MDGKAIREKASIMLDQLISPSVVELNGRNGNLEIGFK